MADVSYSADDAIPETDLLVMAIELHGSSAEAMRDDRINANGRPILRQVLAWAGSWNDETRAALNRDMGDTAENPTVDGLYATLIGMCCQAEPFIEGYGNLGTDDLPPSWPWYTAFGLTPRGRQYAESLLAKHPHLRSVRATDD